MAPIKMTSPINNALNYVSLVAFGANESATKAKQKKVSGNPSTEKSSFQADKKEEKPKVETKVNVYLYGRPIENPSQDFTFVFLPGVPDHAGSGFPIAEGLKAHNNVLLDIGRGYGEPLNYNWDPNMGAEVLVKTLAKLKPSLGNNIILIMYSSGTIEGLRALARTDTSQALKELGVKGAVLICPVAPEYQQFPLDLTFESELASNPFIFGPTYFSLAKMFPDEVGKKFDEMTKVGPNAPAEFLEIYNQPWKDPKGMTATESVFLCRTEKIVASDHLKDYQANLTDEHYQNLASFPLLFVIARVLNKRSKISDVIWDSQKDTL